MFTKAKQILFSFDKRTITYVNTNVNRKSAKSLHMNICKSEQDLIEIKKCKQNEMTKENRPKAVYLR